MSIEENRANYRRFIEEAWNKGNLDIIQEIASPNIIFHSPPGTPPGWEGAKQLIASFRVAFPDVRLTVEDQVAERDKTVTRLMITGTHRGPFQSPGKTLMPTGKRISVQTIDIFRHDANGKLAECWSGFDVFGMLKQLGAIPAADPRASEAIASTLVAEANHGTPQS
jgi:predicted ester cyclase